MGVLKKLMSDDRTHITYTYELAKLIITRSIRAGAGQYLVRLVNDSGKEMADYKVIVLAPPSIARDSLQVKGVRKLTVTFS